MSDKKLVGLNTASRKKKQAALLKTEKAIAKLVKEQQKIINSRNYRIKGYY